MFHPSTQQTVFLHIDVHKRKLIIIKGEAIRTAKFKIKFHNCTIDSFTLHEWI